MADPVERRLRLTRAAQRDFQTVTDRSLSEFGETAAVRYVALLNQTFRDITEDPWRAGSRERPRIMAEGVRIYHIASSRNNVAGDKVHDPRHVLIYRCIGNIVEVGRIIHDSRDIARHVPKAYRS